MTAPGRHLRRQALIRQSRASTWKRLIDTLITEHEALDVFKALYVFALPHFRTANRFPLRLEKSNEIR